jgi:hypothetical protein
MDVRELVRALLSGDLLSARQWVADAYRADMQWERLERPLDLTEREMSVAAGIVELLASRAGGRPPPWTSAVGAVREELVLDPGWRTCRDLMRLRRGPRRNRFADEI